MTQQERTRMACAAKKQRDAEIDTLRAEMPELDALFVKLRHSATLNFLDIMKAISEMVAFYTDHDQFGAADKILSEKMSQNKCLFCS